MDTATIDLTWFFHQNERFASILILGCNRVKFSVHSAIKGERMPLMFNSLLRDAGVSLKDVRLLRHKDRRSAKGKTPYDLRRDNRPQFESYQSLQKIKNRKILGAPYWASFVGTVSGETMFVGLYAVKLLGLLKEDRPWPHADGIDKAGSCDEYKLTMQKSFADLDGKLFIDWGGGERAWVQYAAKHDKRITELRTEFREPEFPGYLNFVQPLSKIDRLPPGWITALKSCKGVYLLTCPKTKEQYVGSASGEQGFWQRWQDYIRTGHGGNVALKSRDPSDYQVSILEVTGTAISDDAIIPIENKWKEKLQSREMGLNR